TRAGAICGYLMRLAPPECYANLRQPAGYASQLFGLEYLLNPAEYLAVLDVAVSDRDRLLLLRDLVATLARLHSLGVVAGDLSAPFASTAPPMYGPPPVSPPAPAVGPSPAAPRRTGRAWVWIPVLAAVVVLAVIAGIAGVLRLSRTGDTGAGPTTGPTATVT